MGLVSCSSIRFMIRQFGASIDGSPLLPPIVGDSIAGDMYYVGTRANDFHTRSSLGINVVLH